ncbi:NAD-dependent epimerase/dehydratase family protein [Yersinia enterocolitica]|uniref:NAD-dependent epimerase/dehydratase family protein n=1 Tax=Yersinia enterocolitica TaxID=630 RepID=UPI0028DECB85|nr:NAD-dependent epimerase/dehydratase family protein [Yersinia enterocolitica]HDZ9831989.1 NAD-dependent epimerase/dehydratase family protein [Yersinia enterocolitica]HEC1640644.1 NAD-dependent epimerase/dehydratase family protein [Yersinia enterocolitica]HEN3296751.1 NAD-dependent epimerase/dehydratase family protein [Yersinia enterocolitica]
MKLAILGATSQLAKDLIIRLFKNKNIILHLYSRNTANIKNWLLPFNSNDYISKDINYFDHNGNYDAIINFIGAGNPTRIKDLGSEIIDITYKYDNLVIEYLKKNSNCKYIFISSGAAYGDVFFDKDCSRTHSCFLIDNNNDFYGLAKYYSEVRHRALQALKIYDLRVFGYFSSSQDIESRFILSDVYRAVRDNGVFITTNQEMIRDYIHPDDFHAMVTSLLLSDINNCALDCYSRCPIDKKELLQTMHDEFGMKYLITESDNINNTKGRRIYYYSKNKKASQLINFFPQYSSKDVIVSEMRKIINTQVDFK